MPKIPRVGPGEVVQLRPVRPDDVGGGAGQAAFSDAAQNLGALSARMIDAERDADVARAEVGYSAKLAEFAQTVDQNPDVDAREAQFEEGRKAISEEFRQGIRGQQYQAAFDQRAFQHGERAKLVVREGVIRKRLDNARGGVIESVDKFDRLIEHSESDQLTKGYVFARSNILDAGVASGAISAAERAQIEESSRKALEQVELRKGSQQRADAIVAGGGSITEQLKAAREIEDPQMQDLVVARVKDRNEEANIARAKAEEAQQDELWRRAHLPADDPNRLTRVQVVEMQNLDAGIRNPLMSFFDSREATGTVKTDTTVYQEAVDLYTNPRRADEAAKTPPQKFFPSLALEQQKEVMAFSKGEFKKQEPLINRLTSEKAAAYLQETATATPEEKKKQELFGRAVREAIESKRLEVGRLHLSQEEIEAIVDGQLDGVIVADKGTFWDSTQRVLRYQLAVPPDDRLRLRTKFKDVGVSNPTDEEIRRAYLEEIEGGDVEPLE